MRTIYINGKFLLQRTTGVQRFARRLILAFDKELAHRPVANRVVLLTPRAAPMLPMQVIEQAVCGKYLCSPTFWEQTALPTAARKGVLLCLSGSAPFFGGIRIPTIHDAAIYLHPEAYSWRFVVWYRMLFKAVIRSAPLKFTVSIHAAQELQLQMNQREFKVVYNAAEHILDSPPDMSVLASLGVSEGGYFLAVGSHNPSKNIAALVAAHAQSGLSSSVPLIIVGATNPQVFSKVIISAVDTPGVVFAGSVTDAALRALYENALAFVFPSLYEGFGIPPLEAMACGCAVVASNAASIPEVCADAALYFDATNVQSIVKALRTVVEEPALRKDLRVRGKARSKHFTWTKSSSALRAHLCEAGLLEEVPV